MIFLLQEIGVLLIRPQWSLSIRCFQPAFWTSGEVCHD